MLPRFVPARSVLRAVAWLAFAPVAWLAAREPFLFGALMIGALLAPFAVSVLAGAIGRRAPGVPALDRDLVSVARHAIWIALAGVVVAVAATVTHVHGIFPKVGLAMIAGAFALGVVGTLAWVSLRRTTSAIYRGARPPLRVQRASDAVDAPALSNVTPLDAAIVEGASHGDGGPYRAGEGRVVARVPSDAKVLARHHASRIALSVFASAACIALGAITIGWPHRDDLSTTPTTLPPFPAECRARPPRLRFVALSPLRVVDIEEIAEHYRRAGVADVLVEDALPFADHFLDPARDQVIGEEIIHAVRKTRPREREDGSLVVVVTDRDMFLRQFDWRFAFATRDSGIAVVSLARMDPNFPLLAPGTYRRERSECRATLRARAFRMITRQILLGVCHAETTQDPRSTRRTSVLGLSDLDAMDEGTY